MKVFCFTFTSNTIWGEYTFDHSYSYPVAQAYGTGMSGYEYTGTSFFWSHDINNYEYPSYSAYAKECKQILDYYRMSY